MIVRRTAAGTQFATQLLNLVIGVPAVGLGLQDPIRPPATTSEVPDTVAIVCGIGASIAPAPPLPTSAFQQSDEEERMLRIARTEPKILTVTTRLLIVEIDLKQLARGERH